MLFIKENNKGFKSLLFCGIMRCLALAISINNEVPSYNIGLMRKIVEYFVSKGYHIYSIDDKTTRPRGFYVFKTNQEKFPPLDEFNKFLDALEDNGVKYKLTPLDDAFGAGLILTEEDKGKFIFERYYGAYLKGIGIEKQ